MSSLPGQWLRAATVNSYTEPAARAYPDLWDVPGGHLELDESELQALTREMHEELGVRIAAESAVRLGRLRSGDGEGAVHVSSWLIGEWEGGPVNIATAEHDEIRWVRMEDLTSLPLAHEGFVGIAWLFVWPGTHVRPQPTARPCNRSDRAGGDIGKSTSPVVSRAPLVPIAEPPTTHVSTVWGRQVKEVQSFHGGLSCGEAFARAGRLKCQRGGSLGATSRPRLC
jgi:8-oxo-dGTP pyrophosphatase MutT (NUDIX family)